MRAWFALIAVVTFLAGSQHPRAFGEDKDSSPRRLAVDETGTVVLDGTALTKSASRDIVQSAWGKPTRVLERRGRVVHYWDALGASAEMRKGASFYGLLHLTLASGTKVEAPLGRYADAPRGRYAGTLAVARVVMDRMTRMDQLRAVGFAEGPEIAELAKAPGMREIMEAHMTHVALERDVGATRVRASFKKANYMLVSVRIELPWSVDPVRSPIAESVVNGDLEGVRMAIQRGARVDTQDAFGRGLLHLAAFHGRADVAALLVTHEANIAAQDKYGATPLHAAATRREWRPPSLILLATGTSHDEVAKLLLKHGADPNARNNHKETPLHCAADSGSLGIAKQLLEHKVKVDPRDEYGATPLFGAASGGVISDVTPDRGRPDRIPGEHVDVARLLLLAGADPNASSEISGTPLARAARHGARATANVLMEGGANPAGVEGAEGFRAPPFLAAARRGDIPLMTDMITHGALLTTIRTRSGMTALHVAASAGQAETVRFLVSRGADLKAVDHDGNTPCHAAARGETSAVAVLEVLRELGSDLHAKNAYGQTLVHAAAGSCLVGADLVDYLVKLKFDLNALDAQGQTPRKIAEDTDCLVWGSVMLEALKKRGAR